ncbi:MAG TPA: hypothetical protein VIS56_00075 [Candidatus Saccharimonadales bacterium]
MSITKIATLGIALLSVVALGGGTAFAQSGATVYQANLHELNGSDTTGTATVEVSGNQLTVTLNTTGASPNLPHAQHIRIGGKGACPDQNADKNKDGLIVTTEGEPSYGKIGISLTTQGDVSASSALAVDRFPTANQDGTVTYQRTFTAPAGVDLSTLGNGVVVQHGISELGGDRGKYDGTAKSDLDPKLPSETTMPAACGELNTVPVGGAGAGGGSTSGTENVGLAVAGVTALFTGAAVAVRGLVGRKS